ncbi:CHAT domain-containing protein [Nostoc sp. FACHB-888]|uniref:CHAT domain-containing protein n=1 Tax=Nostoc sp. FACHB-888 TaxID=2692842 RepID=UPI0016881B8A|nr:CHAT domain-containing protein [Nostoc sp. FACHB-888]MBD2247800.1 CHAT domain-containing protein [Nostoc sp. FACHB-888]
MISFWRLFKYLLLCILGLCIAIGQPSLILAQEVSKQAQQHQAEVLNQRGQRQLDLGQAREALESWQQATKLFEHLKDREGITGTLINQNVALQALGLHFRACKIVVTALKFDAEICATSSDQPADSTKRLLDAEIDKLNSIPVHLLGLQNLGNVLRQLGKLSESKLVLRKTLSIAQQLANFDNSAILLSLNITGKSIYQQARDKYSWIEEPVFQQETVNFIQKEGLELLSNYQSLINTLTVPVSIKLQAQIHRLSLLLDFERWLTAESNLGNRQLAMIQTQINQQIKPSVELILKNSSAFSDLPASQSIYTKLNFANSLNKIPDERLHSVAVQYAESALQTAKSTNKQRLISYAFGTLGKLEKQRERSLDYLEQAMALAQSIQAWDIAYQWQHELGLEYYKQGKYDKALEAYSAAINNLTQVRDNLLASNADLQFSFYEKVEPVYREYMRLLLSSPNPNLELVIQTNEQLQIAELENFLKCGKLDVVALNKLQGLPITTAIIHIIDLGDSIEVIAQSSNHSLVRNSVDAKLIRSHVNNILDAVQSSRFFSSTNKEIILYYQKLYELLIKPIQAYLPSSGTLVFALDRSFQSLPMDLLYNGKNYLIEEYSIVETFGSKIRSPKSLSQNKFTALIAGLSKESPSFNDKNAPKGLKALQEVAVEVAQIKKETDSSTVLLNENFTSLQFKQELIKNDFPIVHISTHGQFSSNSDKTVFLAYDKVINVLEFDSLLKQKTQFNENIIELLVLSACQTAKGNKRSTLGMAGVAAQAGAQSVIASLWLVDEDSTAILMQEFYKGLKNSLAKAEALRQAKLSLLSNPKYVHPYFWSGFVLVGGWL